MADDFDPPKAGKGDAAHAVVRAGLGTIPVAGAAATELLNAIVTPPLEKRRQQWMEKVGEALREIEASKGIKLEDLQNNDVFLDIVLQASQIALRSSQEEKLEALRNAVLNATLPSSPEESIQQMFLSFIDFLTIWHLKIMDLLNNPEDWAQRNDMTFSEIGMGGVSTLIERGFPELRNRRDFYDQLGKDLYARGLINGDNFHVTGTGHGLMQSKTTNMGKTFLSYIKSPINENN